MGMFNLFGDTEYRVFNYKPRYYDQEQDELSRRFGNVDKKSEMEKKDSNYIPGSYLNGAFRDGNSTKRRSSTNKVQNFIGITGLVLIFIVLFYIAKFYTLL